MKTLAYIILLSTLTFSCFAQTKKERQLEQQKPVKLIPNDSMRYNMPVQKTDTYRNNMPVIDSDTSRVKAK
ncbi:MAG: hypothetical protein EOP51_11505 [Sphingobacteriales bacterium]|nr:MAG: hypothetical protein EOP51_11505 [Sphingobacteriales bacterium]